MLQQLPSLPNIRRLAPGRYRDNEPQEKQGLQCENTIISNAVIFNQNYSQKILLAYKELSRPFREDLLLAKPVPA